LNGFVVQKVERGPGFDHVRDVLLFESIEQLRNELERLVSRERNQSILALRIEPPHERHVALIADRKAFAILGAALGANQNIFGHAVRFYDAIPSYARRLREQMAAASRAPSNALCSDAGLDETIEDLQSEVDAA